MKKFQFSIENNELTDLKVWAALSGCSLKKYLMEAAEEKAKRDNLSFVNTATEGTDNGDDGGL